MLYPSMAFLFAIAVFFAVVVTLALRPAATQKVIVIVVLISAVVALALYSFGYSMSATSPQESFVAACRAMFSTTFMFMGRENYSELYRLAPWFANSVPIQVLFWLVHMAAMYAAVSTVLSTIGSRLLRKLRSLALPLGKVCLIYGSDETALSAARQMSKRGYRPLIVTHSDALDADDRADAAGSVVWNESRITEDGKWLARVGVRPGMRALEVMCFDKNDEQTKEFLLRVIDALCAKRISASQVHVSVICQSETNFDYLSSTQIEPGKYLAADVYTTGYLAAMRLIQEAGPYQAMRFDENGVATGDFSAMIIGFGGIGQNVLRLLVRNGQFNGSRFSALVVERDLDSCAGAFASLYADLIKRYNVTFTQTDARSETFVKLLYDAAPRLRYIVVCTGNPLIDRQIANQIRTYQMCHASRFLPRLFLTVCDQENITICGGKARRNASNGEANRGRESDETFPVFRIDDLLEGRPDRLARAVSAIYLKGTALHRYPNNLSEREAFYRNSWYALSNISRMSCRATASAIPAMLAAAGVKEGDRDGLARCCERLVSDADFRLSLSQMEHLRWNAFESSIGVLQMPAEQFERRLLPALAQGNATLEGFAALEARVADPASAERALQEAASLNAAFRSAFGRVRKEIPTYGVGGVHVCLTDWDDLAVLWEKYEPLDTLSRRIEQAYTRLQCLSVGRTDVPEPPAPQNFQQLDTNNVEGILTWLNENRAC